MYWCAASYHRCGAFSAIVGEHFLHTAKHFLLSELVTFCCLSWSPAVTQRVSLVIYLSV